MQLSSSCYCASHIQRRERIMLWLGVRPSVCPSGPYPGGYKEIYTFSLQKLPCIVPQRDIFIFFYVLSHDRLKLYLKIYTAKMKSCVRQCPSQSGVLSKRRKQRSMTAYRDSSFPLPEIWVKLQLRHTQSIEACAKSVV